MRTVPAKPKSGQNASTPNFSHWLVVWGRLFPDFGGMLLEGYITCELIELWEALANLGWVDYL